MSEQRSVMERFLAAAGWVAGSVRHKQIQDALDGARLEIVSQSPADAPEALQVWCGPMPESNGKSNFTAILHKGDLVEGHTIARSEYADRVRYEADRVRYLIGERADYPDVLKYDADIHSGYLAPPVQSAATSEPVAIPTGYALVPLIPTKEQLEAGTDNNPTQWSDGTDPGFAIDVANDIYVSMVGAASTPSPDAGAVREKISSAALWDIFAKAYRECTANSNGTEPYKAQRAGIDAVAAALATPAPVEADIIEQCAIVADEMTAKWGNPNGNGYEQGLQDQGIRIASQIRTLVSRKQRGAATK